MTGQRDVSGDRAASGADVNATRRQLLDALRVIERLEKAVRDGGAASPGTDQQVAIVGLGCRMPGGAGDPESFWRLLRDGVDATREFPANRADAAPFYDADPDAPGKAYVLRGGFLDEVDRFEPAVFGISPREAIGMDPQQRLALEVAWEALEGAGYAPDGLQGSRTGVFVGVSTTDYVRLRQQVGEIGDVDGYQLIGEPSFIAGRISYTLGLTGPSQVVDTACSSSLVALHDACQALRLGECDMALAGGVNLLLSPYGFVLMSKFRALSADGRCKTFDASADGYARGEGAGFVVLRRLADARAAGDNILAVIRGTAVNHDGRSSGMTVPNPASQQAVIRAALAQSGLEPADIGYVEAHGTGTSLGDPIELRALEAVIGSCHADGDPLLVGSVKTNIGHLESAAGVAGLLKLVLSLQHGEIPPHLHLAEPNHNIDWARLHIDVATGVRPWPGTAGAGTARAGAVSSFGASGTNAHAVISEPPAATERTGRRREWNVLTISARTESALRELALRYSRRLCESPGIRLSDAAFTTHAGRSVLARGLAVAGDSVERITAGLAAFVEGRRSDSFASQTLAPHRHRALAWLFTGQGAQYARMGQGLRGEPGYQDAFEHVTGLLDPMLDRPVASVLEEQGEEDHPLHQTAFTQPALFAVEYALARMWLSWGVRPAAVMGHSVGELVAATVAGVMRLEDAVRLVAARGRLMQALPAGGVMATLVCDEERALRAIAGHTETVSVAAVNGPADTVISGPAADVAAITARLTGEGVKHRMLNVSHAFHSPLMTPVLDQLREVAAGIDYRPPDIPLVCNVSGGFWEAGQDGPEYWVRHAVSQVRFLSGIRSLYGEGFRTFLEIGPQPVLSGLGARALDADDCSWIPSLRRGHDDRERVMTAVGALHLRGVGVDWAAFHRGEAVGRLALPTYPWEGEPYWFPLPDQPRSPAVRLPAHDTVPGVGERLTASLPSYRIALDDERWRREARETARGPVASIGSLVDTAMAAATDAMGGAWGSASDVAVAVPLPVDGHARMVELTFAGADDRAETRFEFRSTSAAEEASAAPWRLHASGVLRRQPGFGAGSARCDTADPGVTELAGFSADALDTRPAALSPALDAVVAGAEMGRDGLAARVKLSGGGSQGLAQVLDAAVAAVTWAAGPVQAEAVTPGAALVVGGFRCAAPHEVRSIWASAEVGGDGVIRGSASFRGIDGSPLGDVTEVRLTVGEPASAAEEPWRDPGDLLYRMEWHPAERPPASPDSLAVPRSEVLIVGDRGDVAARLSAEMSARGDRCTVWRLPEGCDPGPDAGGPYSGLLGELIVGWRQDVSLPGRILLLTGLDDPAPERTDAAALREYRDRAELCAVGIVRALLALDRTGDVRLSLVTRGAVPADPVQRTQSAAAGALWGLGRVIALEHPEYWAGAVDLDPGAEIDDDQLRLLLTALAETSSEDQQALRGGRRLAARIVPSRPRHQQLRREAAIRTGASYLITGAFGGIGRLVCRWLALRGAGKLVLLGRTPLPDRAAWDDVSGLDAAAAGRVRAIRDLEDLGTQVEVVIADVADEAAVATLVEGLSTGPFPLRGIVHAAGVSDPQFLRDVTAARYDAVWRPKVVGGWALHRASAHLPLDFFLGFSSIAGTWGSQHLASYAASNAFLDGLAYHRRSRGLSALTVSWGSWELASSLFGDDVAEFLKATGLRMLSAPQCLRLMSSLLAVGETHQIVCAADWSMYKPIMEARAERPVFRCIKIATANEASEAGGRVLGELAAADAADRRAVLDRYLREQLAQILRMDVSALAGEFRLLEMGLDSLMVIELISRSRKDMGVDIKSHEFFATDANLWADFLLRLLEARLPGPPTNTTDGEGN